MTIFPQVLIRGSIFVTYDWREGNWIITCCRGVIAWCARWNSWFSNHVRWSHARLLQLQMDVNMTRVIFAIRFYWLLVPFEPLHTELPSSSYCSRVLQCVFEVVDPILPREIVSGDQGCGWVSAADGQHGLICPRRVPLRLRRHDDTISASPLRGRMSSGELAWASLIGIPYL